MLLFKGLILGYNKFFDAKMQNESEMNLKNDLFSSENAI